MPFHELSPYEEQFRPRFQAETRARGALERVRAARQRAAQPRHSPIEERTSQRPPAMGREGDRTLIAGAGAAGGAALGGMAGGPVGAVIGGGGGARLGSVLTDVLHGQQPDLPTASREGLFGAAGPAGASAVRAGARMVGNVPRVPAAQRASMQKRARDDMRQELENFDSALAAIEKDFGERSAEMAKPFGARAVDTVARKTRAAFDKVASDPDTAMLRARMATGAGEFPAGAGGAGAGALLGGIFSGLEGILGGGAAGFVLGRLRGRAAERLSTNKAFWAWASGLEGKTAGNAMASFMTVIANAKDEQELEDAESFLDGMLGWMALVPTSVMIGAGSAAGGAALQRVRRARQAVGQ